MKKNKYDKKTFTLIKKLLQKQKSEPKYFTLIDEKYLKLLINKEIDFEQIEDEKTKCKNNIEYFIDNYIYVKNKFEKAEDIPDILKDKAEGDKIKFQMYDIQRKLVKAIMNNDKIISVKSRQIGFTTTSLASSTQLISFNNNKTILLFSKSESDAKNTLDEMKFMYNQLPFFLRRVVYKNNEKQLSLGSERNASKIIVQTTGKSSGRSHAATQILFDEADYIQGINDIYRAASFATSATKGKFIVLSTPNLYDSQFHKMVLGAKKGNNGYVLIEGQQYTIPYRDKKQYDEQCAMLNHDKNAIATELDMGQILPYDTYFNNNKLLSIKKQKENQVVCGIVSQYHEPVPDNIYIISVDCQEEGTHNNAIVVYDVYNNKICAIIATKMNIYETLIELSTLYNNAKIMIERNRGFYLIKKFEENELSNLLLPNIKYLSKTDKFEFDVNDNGNPNKIGFVTNKYTRVKLLMHLSNFIYKSKELPKPILDEAKTFIIKRGKPVGIKSDDLLISSGIAILTAQVILDSKSKSDSNKKIKYLINNYQGKSLSGSNKSIEHKQKINKEISKLRKTLISSIDVDGINNLNQLNELEKFNIDTKSKISKMHALLF